MPIWTTEIKELERLYESIKGQSSDLDKELARLIKADDENIILLYSRRCLEIIITDLCESELKRPRKTEPLKGILDKLQKEEKVPSHLIASMHGLNELSTYGAHPKEFDPEQVRPVLINLVIIIKWYLKYKDFQIVVKPISEEEKYDSNRRKVSPIEKSIAVLPFANMSSEKDQDFFCDGIAEEIINTLSHIEGFKVIARTSAYAFKDKQVDIREIGRMLDVETLLEGSIRKDGKRLRVTVQLIKVADGSYIWSERYDREMKDLFAIQDEISLAVADNLKFKLLGETKAMIAKRRSENPEAYILYLKGTCCYQMLTPEGLKKASEYFGQALKLDPGYALAYVELGYIIWLGSMWGSISPGKAYPQINEYVKKALKIDNNLAEAYSLLGTINTFYYWDWKEAEQNYIRALQINPNSPIIHTNYSVLLSFTGRHKEAIHEAKRAQELDPLSSYINARAGMAFQMAGLYDKAIEELQMALTLNPHFFFTHLNLGAAYFAKSMYREAVDEYKMAFDLSNGTQMAVVALGLGYYQIGEKVQAEKLFDSLEKRSETEYIFSTIFYLIYRLRGAEDIAFEWLKRACDEHDTFLTFLKALLHFHPLFLFPEGSRYMVLLKEAGLLK
jgi:TolB-like protein/Tfp pilus assembly protein PilF